MQNMLKEQLMSVLETLTPREQKVIRLRYGLDDAHPRTLEEVGREFSVTRERIRQIEAKALRKLRHPSKLKRLKDDFIEDKDADAPIKTVASELLREDLAEVLCTLSPRERDVLRLRFGMDDGRQRTLEEVGQLFGVTRERIRQIEAKALRKLRHPNRSKRLREYVEN
jgi:RNA polymerase primary sigma factor